MSSGVYIIECILNNKIYVGSSIDLNKRIKTHFNDLRKNKHTNPKLQRSFNKYGEGSFKFYSYVIDNVNLLRIREQTLITLLMPEFNISLDAIAPMQGRKHSETTLMKFKNRPIKKGKDHYWFGKKQSEDHKLKTLAIKLGSKRPPTTRKKMSETAKRINSIGRIDRTKCMKKIIDSEGNRFISMSECSKFWNISVQTVCDILKGRHNKTRKGVRFFYEQL